MNLLINEPPLQVLPSLAKKVGLNEALILQQIHFRLLISNHHYDGHKWIYNSYPAWKQEFPFWSERTIMRTINKLEENGYIISTSEYNKIRQDKTKWYRLDYTKLGYTLGQNGSTTVTTCQYGNGQNGSMENDNVAPPLPKSLKDKENNNVEKLDVAQEIINYLNTKTNKNYRATTPATKRLINGRLADGYGLDDFKRVIDLKASQWLNDPHWSKYLRPDTLFNPNKFEAYLNEAPSKPKQSKQPAHYQPPQLNFSEGENIE